MARPRRAMRISDSTAEIVTSDGARVDLRNIRSPILCFCSKGDNITPPAQALGWIIDLYGSDEDLLASGQTIVYAIHEHIGHLGIFVSGGVAKKEHDEFGSNIDLIDVLPPTGDMSLARYQDLANAAIGEVAARGLVPILTGGTPLYINAVIEGWQIALLRMHPGSRWIVYIPYTMGYGTRTSGPIPAYSTLIFEVELLNIS